MSRSHNQSAGAHHRHIAASVGRYYSRAPPLSASGSSGPGWRRDRDGTSFYLAANGRRLEGAAGAAAAQEAAIGRHARAQAASDIAELLSHLPVVSLDAPGPAFPSEDNTAPTPSGAPAVTDYSPHALDECFGAVAAAAAATAQANAANSTAGVFVTSADPLSLDAGAPTAAGVDGGAESNATASHAPKRPRTAVSCTSTLAAVDDVTSLPLLPAPAPVAPESATSLSFPKWAIPPAFARALRSRGVQTFYPWQAACLSLPGVLSGRRDLVVAAGTSGGKTLVAAVITLHRLFAPPSSRTPGDARRQRRIVLLIVPLTALASATAADLAQLFAPIGVTVAAAAGPAAPPAAALAAAADVLVLTYEKAAALLWHLVAARAAVDVAAVIVDEAHTVAEPHRGPPLEALLSALAYSRRAATAPATSAAATPRTAAAAAAAAATPAAAMPAAQLVLLSATLPHQGVAVARWLGAQLYPPASGADVCAGAVVGTGLGAGADIGTSAETSVADGAAPAVVDAGARPVPLEIALYNTVVLTGQNALALAKPSHVRGSSARQLADAFASPPAAAAAGTIKREPVSSAATSSADAAPAVERTDAISAAEEADMHTVIDTGALKVIAADAGGAAWQPVVPPSSAVQPVRVRGGTTVAQALGSDPEFGPAVRAGLGLLPLCAAVAAQGGCTLVFAPTRARAEDSATGLLAMAAKAGVAFVPRTQKAKPCQDDDDDAQDAKTDLVNIKSEPPFMTPAATAVTPSTTVPAASTATFPSAPAQTPAPPRTRPTLYNTTAAACSPAAPRPSGQTPVLSPSPQSAAPQSPRLPRTPTAVAVSVNTPAKLPGSARSLYAKRSPVSTAAGAAVPAAAHVPAPPPPPPADATAPPLLLWARALLAAAVLESVSSRTFTPAAAGDGPPAAAAAVPLLGQGVDSGAAAADDHAAASLWQFCASELLVMFPGSSAPPQAAVQTCSFTNTHAPQHALQPQQPQQPQHRLNTAAAVLLLGELHLTADTAAAAAAAAAAATGAPATTQLPSPARARVAAAALLSSAPVGVRSLARLCLHGIAMHHGGVPTPARAAVEMGFRCRVLLVLVATTTLAAGVNLPARVVVIRAPTTGTEPLAPAQLRQMAGRAGRAGQGEAAGLCVLMAGNADAARAWRGLVFAPDDECTSAWITPAALKGGSAAEKKLSSSSSNSNSSSSSATAEPHAGARVSFVLERVTPLGRACLQRLLLSWIAVHLDTARPPTDRELAALAGSTLCAHELSSSVLPSAGVSAAPASAGVAAVGAAMAARELGILRQMGFVASAPASGGVAFAPGSAAVSSSSPAPASLSSQFGGDVTSAERVCAPTTAATSAERVWVPTAAGRAVFQASLLPAEALALTRAADALGGGLTSLSPLPLALFCASSMTLIDVRWQPLASVLQRAQLAEAAAAVDGLGGGPVAAVGENWDGLMRGELLAVAATARALGLSVAYADERAVGVSLQRSGGGGGGGGGSSGSGGGALEAAIDFDALAAETPAAAAATPLGPVNHGYLYRLFFTALVITDALARDPVRAAETWGVRPAAVLAALGGAPTAAALTTALCEGRGMRVLALAITDFREAQLEPALLFGPAAAQLAAVPGLPPPHAHALAAGGLDTPGRLLGVSHGAITRALVDALPYEPAGDAVGGTASAVSRAQTQARAGQVARELLAQTEKLLRVRALIDGCSTDATE